MIRDLLPAFSTAKAYALATIWDSWTERQPLIADVKFFGLTIIPDDWVPWLIWDLGLEDVVPYVRDMRQALAEGPAWQRARGTARGIEIGIGWVESAGVVAEPDQRHNWWEFQVGFAVPASDVEQLRQLLGIINLSKASEDELFRMFSPGADYRPVRMDLHRMDDGQMDGYSGVRLWDGGPLISMGWVGASAIETESETTVSLQRFDTSLSVWFEGLRFDTHRMGERPAVALASVTALATATDDYLLDDDAWPLVWPESWDAATEPHLASTSWGEE